MKITEKFIFEKLLDEILFFQEQGENLNLNEFETWKVKTSNLLKDNYKIRFNRLKFYSIYDDSEPDDLPF